MAVSVGEISIGPNHPLCIIAGPCQIESRQHAFDMAGTIKDICQSLSLPFIYKSSFDKANRTSMSSQRGVGLDAGLEILSSVKQNFKIPVLTDIHESYQAEITAAAGIDVLQIPAFLCRQTDLLMAAANTGCVINVKKGQFLAPADMARVAEKISVGGNHRILLTERGVTHGYNNLVVDMRSLPTMARTGYPVVFDCTHSVQQPGGLGQSSGGDRGMVPYLGQAAMATGCVSAVFIETHQDPDCAPSDGPNMVPVDQLADLIKQFKKIHELVATF